MYKKRASCSSILWSAFQIAVGAGLLVLVACWRMGGEMPTRVPTAPAPTLDVARAWGTIPPTYTPGALVQAPAQPSYIGTPAATATLPGELGIPLPQLPPTPSATPFVAPAYLLRTVTVAEYERPPLATDCDGTGVVFRSRYRSDIYGPWRYYHAYLPPCYGQDGRVYPVLYLFHGSGHTDYQWVDLGIAQHIDQGIVEGRYPPFIVIMPNDADINDQTSGGPRSVEGIVLEHLIPFVDANFCTWGTREGRSIGGISRGGYWALMLAFRHTDLFGVVSGHSSQLRLDVDPPKYNPRATYALADLSNTQIWMDWGEHDFLRPGQWYMHRSLMDAGIPHHVQINPGGHNQTYWYAHTHQYLDWHATQWPLERANYPFCQLSTTQEPSG
ncbi:MAG: alpha/beta hydrolase-fold protein [Candidatus Promineifilaceae bacterium]|nr:alpha/beta hydrolase-fold protein [Candidatus Promineifilaceae bacterium]